MIQIPHFEIHELVDKETYNSLGEKSVWMLNPKAVDGLVKIRKHFNKPMTVNNWYWGGKLENRGYRSIYSTTGAKFSQHRVGNAWDINIKGISSDMLNDYLVKNYRKFGITTIEDKSFTPTWTHIDFRNTGQKDLLIVKP